MKRQKLIVIIVSTILLGTTCYAQKNQYTINAGQVPACTHVHLDDFPHDQTLPIIKGWGGMAVDINNAPAGTDFTPLLQGLQNDHCQVPHWGYVIEGSLQVMYEDGSKEVFAKGEAFFMKPGHTAVVIEDLFLVSFSPEDAMEELIKHIEQRVDELNGSSASK
ncbi:hypothetical protein J1N10_01120 [Carboxylicivirga sp. A043]|uniref:hypothetical protein n=1 Tax=Carboxylicivirga litoralis TaxID=2816963 RepID=UPI0021CB9536|nr:hypothetical protein [Carboxylicivirga sp. A043]MCU4154555.1 hypothetical protein [Carboxylicivirga sp. A043]